MRETRERERGGSDERGSQVRLTAAGGIRGRATKRLSPKLREEAKLMGGRRVVREGARLPVPQCHSARAGRMGGGMIITAYLFSPQN